MVENYILIDGTPSTNFGVYVSDSNLFDSASEDIDIIEVQGRNGSLHISNDRYNSFNYQIDCYIKKNMMANLEAFKSFLLSKKTNVKIINQLKPTEYRYGRYVKAFKIDDSNPTSATFTLEFNCRPERFLISGETEQTFTASGSITNPTAYASKPMIRTYGNGSVKIGDRTIQVNTTQPYVDIDCDSMNCYCGDVNCNNDVIVNEFPVIESGSNQITITGLTQVKVKGRWWNL